MAEFDPVVQPSGTDIQSGSRPIDVPANIQPRGVEQNQIMPQGVREGDRSAEYFGRAREYGLTATGVREKSFADIFSGVSNVANYLVNAADTMIKKNIENEVYAKSDIQREFYTEELQNIAGKGGAGIKSFLDANAQATDDDVPQELGDLPEKLDAMAGASPSGTGRMTNTNYYGRLLALSKDLRARYPGYRQYIDDQFARVTGVNPANAVIGQLLGEINRNSTSASSQRNRALTFITQNSKLLGAKATPLYRAVEAGTAGMPEVLDAIRPKQAEILQYEDDKRSLELEKGGEDILRSRATTAYTRRVEQTAGTAVETMMVNVGADTKTGLIDFLKGAKQGRYDSTTLKNVGSWILNVKIPEIEAGLNMESRQPFGKSGRSFNTALGFNLRNDINSEALKPLKHIANSLIAGETRTGLMFDTALDVLTQKNDFTGKMYKDPNIAPNALMLDFFDKHGGQAAVSVIMDKALMDGFDGAVREVHSSYTKQFRAQVARENDSRYVTLNDALKTAQTRQVARPAELVNRLAVEAAADLTKADVPEALKANLIKAMFSDGNINFIESLGKDGRDAKGNPVPGTYEVWRTLTRPGVREAIQKFAGKENSQFYADYTNWVQTTQRNLFQREVQALNNIKGLEGVQFGYDGKSNKFWIDDISPTQNDPFNKYRKNQVNEAKVAVARINMGLEPIIDIAKAENKTPEAVTAYILRKAKETGLDLHAEVQGLPSQMYKELVNASVNQTKSKERSEKEKNEYEKPLQFTPATPARTMQDFINNPTGSTMPSRGRGKPTDALKPEGGTPVAPRGNASPRASVNQSTKGDIVSMDTLDIPEGMSPSEYIAQLRSEGKM